MKTFTKILTVAFALLIFVSVRPLQAKQYCQEPITVAGSTIYLTCELLGSTYQMTIAADVELAGLGGSFMTLSDGNHDLREFMTKGADGKSLVLSFISATAPYFYTPLYVMMPGEVNFGLLDDVEWGLCSTDDTEYTITVVQPAQGGTISANLSQATYGTEVVLTATPDEGKELAAWSVTDDDNNAINVSKGVFNMPASNVTVTATFRDPLNLTPAVHSGTTEFDNVHYAWSVTRNVDQTLTFAIQWDQDLVGISPQININNGAFIGMLMQDRSATYSTTATYEDGTELPFFFYIAYAGNAARIDVNYIVGTDDSLVDPNPNPNPDPTLGVDDMLTSPRATKLLRNGQMLIIHNGNTFTLTGTQL